jgi:hypothetical protein
VSGVTQKIDITNIDKVDLLFMVDNSNSMEDKQMNLRQHVPQLVETLVSGRRFAMDPNPFPPVTDLHIAVVDSDMGLPGVTSIPGCTGNGHDGLFQHTPLASPENPQCDASYPNFLSYAASNPNGPSSMKVAQDFGCIANVGVTGCGFEQQLESALKSLWPANNNLFQFLGPSGQLDQRGHGDLENIGFLRNTSRAPSLLVIIMLSDEDDGSTGEMELYRPSSMLAADSWVEPSTRSDLNLRALIGGNRNHLYNVQRYVNGFKALRPGQETLVMFAAITGVPIDLVDANATTGVDFANQGQRDAYYDRILNDPRMQNVPDATPSPKKMVEPACLTSFGKGYPGRRYIEVAKGFGENATVYSICEPDYTPALDNVINLIVKFLYPVCLPRPLVRNLAGEVSCDVVWELPTAVDRPSLETPIACSERPGFLSTPAADQPQQGPNGGNLCVVTQLAVVAGAPKAGDGWYYDDSEDVKKSCRAATPQRVTFTALAKPPTGVTVKLQCLNQTQLIVESRPNVVPNNFGRIATIGSSCEPPTAAVAADPAFDVDILCAVQFADGTADTSLFCDPQTNTCVKGCVSSTICPPAWVCDSRPETLSGTATAKRPGGSPICVNPTCGN